MFFDDLRKQKQEQAKAYATSLLVRTIGSTSQARTDARRDAVLARAGYRVLRLDAALVVRDIEAAVSRVRAALGR